MNAHVEEKDCHCHVSWESLEKAAGRRPSSIMAAAHLQPHLRTTSSICIVQAEDRPLLRDLATTTSNGPVGTTGMSGLLETNRLLCQADSNCSYVRHDSAYKEVEPHWRKVFIASHVLNTTRCPAIAWLDSDAVLGDKPSNLLSLLRPVRAAGTSIEQATDHRYVWPSGARRPPAISRPSEIHMVVAGEGDVYNHNLSPFNAGVWIVANTRIGRALMARWCGVYTETASKYWKRDLAGKHTGQDDLSWQCVQPDERPRADKGATRACDFSKEHYEQGAFVQHVLTKAPFVKNIRQVPWAVLQSPHIHPMVHHFIGPPKTKDRYMKDFFKYRGERARVVRESR